METSNQYDSETDTEIRILVAEDSGLSFTLIETMLERLTGVKPDRAINGIDAVEKVAQQHYDLIIMDEHMPEMSGIEATQCIRKDNNNQWQQPFIAGCSGAATQLDIMRYEQAGMNYFIAKPLRLKQLQVLLDLVVQSRSETVAFESSESLAIAV